MCASLTGDGGPCTCLDPRPPLTTYGCERPNEGMCCVDADCPQTDDGRDAFCQAAALNARDGYCGGVAPRPINGCVSDMCSEIHPCADDLVCVPAGAYNHVLAACIPATCHTDADCDQGVDGVCRPFFFLCNTGSFVCTYSTDECSTDADCPDGPQFPNICVPMAGNHGMHCEANPARP